MSVTATATMTCALSTPPPPPPPPPAQLSPDHHETAIPRRPDPSSDPYLAAPLPLQTPATPPAAPPTRSHRHDDLFALPATEALRLLAASIEALVRITGDVPPTPPPSDPLMPNMRGMQAEKANLVRSHSEKNLARLRAQAEQERPRPHMSRPGACAPSHDAGPDRSVVDGVRLRQTPSPTSPCSPSSHGGPLEPYIVIGEDSQPLNLQHSAITRKFYSKNEPPITVGRYLQRLHQYCPMSTAVYLATSLYIHRLAVEERSIPVTRRNAHRLLLAGLRVAMKALEDLSYPHVKMARVGGVSEVELARLEIAFCFLAGFELVVCEDTLYEHWLSLRRGREITAGVGGSPSSMGPLKIRRKKDLVDGEKR